MRSTRNIGFYIVSVFIYLIFVSSQTYAASVLKSNAKQAIIQLDDLEFSVTQGDQVVVMSNSKRVGILKIVQISAGKAKANILKGKAPVGGQVVTANAAGGGSGGGGGGTVSSSKKWHYGGVLGYFLDSQTTTLAQGTTPVDVAQTGNGYAGKAFGEVAISGNLYFMGRFGIETFNVAGTASATVCSGSTANCSTQIMYVDGDALLKYNFSAKKFVPFVAFGLGLFFPVTKSSTALNSIPTISVFFLDAGADIQMGANSYIPVYFEYGLFPPSNQVKTSYMGLMLGYGVRM